MSHDDSLQSAAPILVVEDSNDDFEIIERALRTTADGIPCVHCRTGDEALNYLLYGTTPNGQGIASHPCLIFLDLNLPGTDGREVLFQIKMNASLRHIPIIVLTGSRDRLDIEACYRAGANSYIHKPADVATFVERVQQLSAFWLEDTLLPGADPW